LLLAQGATAPRPADEALDAATRRACRDLATAIQSGSGGSIGAFLSRATSADHFAAARIGPWLSGEDTDRLDPADFLAARDGEDWLLPDGYGTLVASFGAPLPVRLGCPVEAIRTTRERVELATAQGIVRSRYAILTVPMGVLQAGRIQLDPSPTSDVEAAWEGLPMGTLTKVGIGFDSDVFGLGRDFYLFAEPTSERSILYLVRPGGRNHVMAFIGGSLARELAALPGPALREAVAAPLVAHLGTAISDHIGACLASEWHRDPWAMGSYAMAQPGMAGARTALRVPLSERLVYAGEAAASDGWHGTVAGAYLSGRAAACNVAQAASCGRAVNIE
jgi:monoamine oxidase